MTVVVGVPARETLAGRTSSRLLAESIERIVALIVGESKPNPVTLALVRAWTPRRSCGKAKRAPGNASLETTLTGVDKLLVVRAIGLPPDLFADVPPKVAASVRAPADVDGVAPPPANAPLLLPTTLAAVLCTSTPPPVVSSLCSGGLINDAREGCDEPPSSTMIRPRPSPEAGG
jgi:hypothetical protein